MIAARETRWWFERLQVGLFERLGPAPYELVDHLSHSNILEGRAEIADAAHAPDAFLADVAAALDGMPMAVLQMLESRLLGVYFCRGLGSSAATDIVVTPSGMVIGAVVMLDVDVLDRTSANDWASWRERGAFAADADMDLTMTLTAAQFDDRMHAMQYLLLHEFGHVLATAWLHMPQWWCGGGTLEAADAYHFLPFSWQIDAHARIVPLSGQDCGLRERLGFYGEATMGADDAADLYEWLQTSNFCSLYGATTVFEDFAETFAGYVHVRLLDHCHTVRLALPGRPALVIDDYWDSERSAAKRQFMQRFLGLG